MTEHKTDENINDVLGQVAYQIKEAMGSMYGSLHRSTVLDARDADGMTDDAAIVMHSFFRLRRLAANLEEAANLDAPPLPITKNDDIIGLCAAVTDRAQHAARLLGLTLEFKSERSSHIIALDAMRIERLLLNLLSNAFKFTPTGGTVTVEVRVSSQNVEICVSDTGCGISGEKMKTLFDRYRGMNYPDGTPRGLGLGLPICRKIAQDHGGTVVVVSTEGDGTRVTASLENRKSMIIEMNAYVTDYSGGFNRTLLELSDALPRQAFERKMMD